MENGEDLYSDISDPVLDTLADAFTSTTMDGINGGFSSEHFYHYAGQVRILDACLEEKGTNAKMNKRLAEDDYYLLNPDGLVETTKNYWKRHGIVFEEDNLMRLASIDAQSYKAIKKAIRKLGGVQRLHEKVAAAFERKAEELTSMNLQSGLRVQGGYVRFPARPNTATVHNFLFTQLELFYLNYQNMFGNLDINCLCKALSVEGAALSILCATVCQPCCVPSAIMLALGTLLESLGYCSSDQC